MAHRYIGLDIGGSKIDGILWKGGKILREKRIKTPRSRKKFLAALAGLIREIGGIEEIKRLDGIGIAVAGAVNLQTGVVVRSPNMEFISNFPLKKFLEKKFRKPVRLDNDTKCFLRAEQRFGSARGKKNVLALTLGTGVGGAVLVNNQMLRGSHVTAVEFGRMIIGELPTRFYTLEDLVSSHGYRRLGISDPVSSHKKALAHDRNSIKVHQIMGTYLGIGLANLVNIFDPELIVIGGGISKSAKLFLPSAFKVLKQYTPKSIPKLPPVRVSKLKHAEALGAVSLFFK